MQNHQNQTQACPSGQSAAGSATGNTPPMPGVCIDEAKRLLDLQAWNTAREDGSVYWGDQYGPLISRTVSKRETARKERADRIRRKENSKRKSYLVNCMRTVHHFIEFISLRLADS